MKSRAFAFWLSCLAVIAGILFLADPEIKGTERGTAATEASAGLPSLARLVSAEPPPRLAARAFLSAWLRPDGQIEVLAEKNARRRWPIASISKLFTAGVVTRDYDQNQTVAFLPADFEENNSDRGFFQTGQNFRVADLLVSLLLDSSNAAAAALARSIGRGEFVGRINNLAEELSLQDTKLFNPSGLDPDGSPGANYSSVHDLALLGRWLIRERPALLALTRLPLATVFTADGAFHHQARNTNELLLNDNWSARIIGGKTGQTDLAGKNLLLILQTLSGRGHLINVILGSPEHFREMDELTGWVNRVYQL